MSEIRDFKETSERLQRQYCALKQTVSENEAKIRTLRQGVKNASEDSTTLLEQRRALINHAKQLNEQFFLIYSQRKNFSPFRRTHGIRSWHLDYPHERVHDGERLPSRTRNQNIAYLECDQFAALEKSNLDPIRVQNSTRKLNTAVADNVQETPISEEHSGNKTEMPDENATCKLVAKRRKTSAKSSSPRPKEEFSKFLQKIASTDETTSEQSNRCHQRKTEKVPSKRKETINDYLVSALDRSKLNLKDGTEVRKTKTSKTSIIYAFVSVAFVFGLWYVYRNSETRRYVSDVFRDARNYSFKEIFNLQTASRGRKIRTPNGSRKALIRQIFRM